MAARGSIDEAALLESHVQNSKRRRSSALEGIRRLRKWKKKTSESSKLRGDERRKCATLIESTILLTHLFPSFPPSMLVCMVAREDGNCESVLRCLVALGWQPTPLEDLGADAGQDLLLEVETAGPKGSLLHDRPTASPRPSRAQETDAVMYIQSRLKRPMPRSANPHFCTAYFHGEIYDMSYVRRLLTGRQAGCFLTFFTYELNERALRLKLTEDQEGEYSDRSDNSFSDFSDNSQAEEEDDGKLRLFYVLMMVAKQPEGDTAIEAVALDGPAVPVLLLQRLQLTLAVRRDKALDHQMWLMPDLPKIATRWKVSELQKTVESSKLAIRKTLLAMHEDESLMKTTTPAEITARLKAEHELHEEQILFHREFISMQISELLSAGSRQAETLVLDGVVDAAATEEMDVPITDDETYGTGEGNSERISLNIPSTVKASRTLSTSPKGRKSAFRSSSSPTKGRSWFRRDNKSAKEKAMKGQLRAAQMEKMVRGYMESCNDLDLVELSMAKVHEYLVHAGFSTEETQAEATLISNAAKMYAKRMMTLSGLHQRLRNHVKIFVETEGGREGPVTFEQAHDHLIRIGFAEENVEHEESFIRKTLVSLQSFKLAEPSARSRSPFMRKRRSKLRSGEQDATAVFDWLRVDTSLTSVARKTHRRHKENLQRIHDMLADTGAASPGLFTPFNTEADVTQSEASGDEVTEDWTESSDASESGMVESIRILEEMESGPAAAPEPVQLRPKTLGPAPLWLTRSPRNRRRYSRSNHTSPTSSNSTTPRTPTSGRLSSRSQTFGSPLASPSESPALSPATTPHGRPSAYEAAISLAMRRRGSLGLPKPMPQEHSPRPADCPRTSSFDAMDDPLIQMLEVPLPKALAHSSDMSDIEAFAEDEGGREEEVTETGSEVGKEESPEAKEKKKKRSKSKERRKKKRSKSRDSIRERDYLDDSASNSPSPSPRDMTRLKLARKQSEPNFNLKLDMLGGSSPSSSPKAKSKLSGTVDGVTTPQKEKTSAVNKLKRRLSLNNVRAAAAKDMIASPEGTPVRSDDELSPKKKEKKKEKKEKIVLEKKKPKGKTKKKKPSKLPKRKMDERVNAHLFNRPRPMLSRSMSSAWASGDM